MDAGIFKKKIHDALKSKISEKLLHGTLSIELLHHELPADLITQEQGSICREGADHGRGQTRVERPHT